MFDKVAYARNYYRNHPEFRAKVSLQSKKRYEEHKEEIKAQHRQYYQKNKEQLKAQNKSKAKERHLQNKIDVVTHYSNGTMACANPFGEHKEPYTTFEALTADHINNDGAEQRRKFFKQNQRGTGSLFYRWLIKNNYPEGIQILCMNCQFIKQFGRKEYELKLGSMTECKHYDREEIDFYLVLSREFIKLIQCKVCKQWLNKERPQDG